MESKVKMKIFLHIIKILGFYFFIIPRMSCNSEPRVLTFFKSSTNFLIIPCIQTHKALIALE